MGLRLRKYIELRDNWAAENYSGPSANIAKLRYSCSKVCNSLCGYSKHGITKDAFNALQISYRPRSGRCDCTPRGSVISTSALLLLCIVQDPSTGIGCCSLHTLHTVFNRIGSKLFSSKLRSTNNDCHFNTQWKPTIRHYYSPKVIPMRTLWRTTVDLGAYHCHVVRTSYWWCGE